MRQSYWASPVDLLPAPGQLVLVELDGTFRNELYHVAWRDADGDWWIGDDLLGHQAVLAWAPIVNARDRVPLRRGFETG